MPSIQYTVEAGDTLSKLGRRFNTTWAKIASDNSLSNPNIIKPGDVLTINLPDFGAQDRKAAYIRQFEMMVERVETAPTAAVGMYLEELDFHNSHAINTITQFLEQHTNDAIDQEISKSSQAWWDFIHTTGDLTTAILTSPPFNDYGGGSGYAMTVGLARARLMRARIEQLYDLLAFYE